MPTLQKVRIVDEKFIPYHSSDFLGTASVEAIEHGNNGYFVDASYDQSRDMTQDTTRTPDDTCTRRPIISPSSSSSSPTGQAYRNSHSIMGPPKPRMTQMHAQACSTTTANKAERRIDSPQMLPSGIQYSEPNDECNHASKITWCPVCFKFGGCCDTEDSNVDPNYDPWYEIDLRMRNCNVDKRLLRAIEKPRRSIKRMHPEKRPRLSYEEENYQSSSMINNEIPLPDYEMNKKQRNYIDSEERMSFQTTKPQRESRIDPSRNHAHDNSFDLISCEDFAKVPILRGATESVMRLRKPEHPDSMLVLVPCYLTVKNGKDTLTKAFH